MAFRSISDNYTITTQGELGVILQNFDPDMIYSVLENNMESKYREYEFNLTNLVISYEYTFKDLTTQYGTDKDILRVRDDTYRLIAGMILKFHNIEMLDTETELDTFTVSSILYELFVSNFTSYITRFFVTYIYREKDSLYNMLLSIEEDKKLKNNSILYSKKLYEDDPKLAALHAYIPKIIESMCGFNISLHEYIATAYKYEPEKANLLNSLLVNNDYFYSNHVVPFVKMHMVRIITDVRLTLQSTLPTNAALNIPM